MNPRPVPEAPSTRSPKLCASCGRTIEWRKKWRRDWDSIRFCSDGCRQHQPSAVDQALETNILALLAQRGRDKTICPSEAARAVAARHAPIDPANPSNPAAWQALMEPARAAARRLAADGRIVITQSGHPVDPSTARGPIRLKLS